MGLESWGSVIGTSASICTILQMLSPLPSCYKFYLRQSVGDMIVTPYVVAMTSCSLWLLYGIIIQDPAVIRVNIAGLVLQIFYISCYYFYCVRKGQVLEQIMSACATVTAALIYSLLEKDHDRLIIILGLVSCCMTVIFFVSPLANIQNKQFLLLVIVHGAGALRLPIKTGYVLRIWNSESLPRLLIASTFMVSVQWTLYGFIIKDKFIQVTNLLGSVLSGFQLVLILIIPAHYSEKLISNI